MNKTEPRASGFADRLASAVIERQTPVMVGLDPRWDHLPEALRSDGDASPVQRAAAYRRFCREVIDVVAPLVAVVKPQAAFFEQLGVAGMEALADCIAYARAAGLLVVLDAKRGDIGSTATAYADGLLGPTCEGMFAADAVTVNPYLGDDALEPFFEVARKRDAGVFVLVKTSNPGGRMLQDLQAGGRPIYRHVAEYVEGVAHGSQGRCGYGVAGAVVGATYPEQLAELREVMPHCWLLVPGFGSQGGTARDVAGAFDQRGLGAVINSSRHIIFAHARSPYAERFAAADWQRAVEAATRDMIDRLRSDTPAGQLGSV